MVLLELTGMGNRRDAAVLRDETDHVGWRHARMRDVRGSAFVEIAIEGVGDRRGMAGRNQRRRNLRTGDRFSGSLGGGPNQRLDVDWRVHAGEPLGDLLGARDASLALVSE